MGSDASGGPAGTTRPTGKATLAIDTAAAQCAVAVVSDGHAWRQVEKAARGHAELLFPMIAAVLAEAGVGYAGLGRLVCCTGPGSFAGTRIGVAAVRGLALSTGLPAAGVSRFAALAAEARGQGAGAVGVVLAGRGGNVLFQAFGADGVPLAPPAVAPEDREPDLPALDALAGDGAPGWTHLPRLLADGLPDPAVLARLGAAADAAGPPSPLYLRPPAADLPREGPPRMLD